MFRGRRADLVKIVWHDDLGMNLYAKRLERGRFVWPQATQGLDAAPRHLPPEDRFAMVSLTPAALSMLLEGIDWRHPQRTWRPAMAVSL